jgi:4-methyl-5(b-hydroxyethyl)-thiazole monophosphate biosynthesis
MPATDIVVPLMEGFEEIEAVTIIDVLRRAGLKVVTAGIAVGPVRGAHGIVVAAEAALAGIDPARVRMVVLPGGMPGAAHLTEDEHVQRIVRGVAAHDGYTAAICAAPMALAAADVIRGRRVTCYPGFESHLVGGVVVDDRVVVDGTLITSRGPGTSLEFALTLVGLLQGEDAEGKLARGMIVARSAQVQVQRAL